VNINIASYIEKPCLLEFDLGKQWVWMFLPKESVTKNCRKFNILKKSFPTQFIKEYIDL